jgi:hypothetical protein
LRSTRGRDSDQGPPVAAELPAIADHMRAELVVDALRMAARNYALEPEAIFTPIMPSLALSRGIVSWPALAGLPD